MILHGESVGRDGDRSAPALPGRMLRSAVAVTFTPMVFDGRGWSRITSPQEHPRAACLLVTAHIHLFRPELPLRDLDARAEPAIRELEDGAETVMIIDDHHRVDRNAPSVPYRS
jgi:hypothetical protein